MKIRSISIENFRLIQNQVTISLRPVTLLFGPNSAGKSTILQSILTFREVLKNRNPDPHFVFGGGSHIDLGGFSALVHRHDLSKQIRIKICFEINTDDGIDDLSSFSEEIQNSGIVRLTDATTIETVAVGISLAYDSSKRKPFINRYEIDINGTYFGAMAKEFLEDRVALSLNTEHPVFEDIDDNEKNPLDGGIIQLYEILNDRLKVIRQNVGEGIEVIAPDLAAGVIPIWGRGLPIWQDDQDKDIAPHEYAALEQILSEAFVVIGGMAMNHIDSLIYLGPFRTVPTRDYSAPHKLDINRWADGLAAWDTLCVQHREKGLGGSFFVKKVSDFVSGKNNLDLGYSIEIQSIRSLRNVDSIVGDLIRLANDEELSPVPIVEKIRRGLDELPVSLKVQLRDEKRHIDVEADDIGVGVSQVVPVVVGAMDPAHKVFFVEQPELHIHPRVQCSLADLFIEQINASSEKMFVLETHSEHLILRLLRRIRETYEQNSADPVLNSDNPVLPETRHLTPDQIGIIYIDSDENGMNVTNIGVTPEGDFETRWPGGFFDERLKEVF